MTELQMLWAWIDARIDQVRDKDADDTGSDNDAGFTTLEWVAIAGVVVVAAIIVATVLMNKAKDGANNVNVQ